MTVHAISGYASAGFEPVQEAFIENFRERDEQGAACCVYYRGEKVVDLWGGVRDAATGEPWEENTMVIVFSATKGMAGLALALAHSRGLLDYDARVAEYWPEFAQAGKEDITLRQLLAHQAGLYAFDGQGDRELIADPDRLAEALARQKPAWEPGSRHGYHALTLGFYESEILRRVDPAHRTLGQFFQDEIATPLGLNFYIRLPESIPGERLAIVQMKHHARGLFTMPLGLYFAALNPRAAIRRALQGSLLPLDEERVYARNFEMPAGGGVGTARALAHAYGEVANGGKTLDLRTETLALLSAPPTEPAHGFHDEVLKIDARYALGFARPSPGDRFGSPAAFGHPGAGGAFGFADPASGVGYGYVPNRLDRYLVDPRDRALRQALARCIQA